MKEKAIKEAKAFNAIVARGLDLPSKLELFFDNLQELVKSEIGEEAFEAVQKVVHPVTKDDINKIVTYFYDDEDNYEYQDYTKEDVEKAFESLYNEEEREKINKHISEYLLEEFAERDKLIRIANKYYKHFWSGSIDYYLDKVILNLDISLEEIIKEIIKRV